MIKKQYKWLSFSILSILLAGCGLFSNQETTEPNPKPPTEEIEEVVPEDENEPKKTIDKQDLNVWLPRLDNVRYSYEGIGNEYATFDWTPQFNQENYYQFVTDNGGTKTAEIYEYKENEVVRIFQRPETYFRDNFSEIGNFTDQREEEVILKAPIEVGNSWSSNENDYEITAIDHEIEVPAGTYQTIEVTINMDDMVVKRYYAKDVGLVSEVSETEGMTIESNLETITTETPEVLPFFVYIPDEQAMGLDQVEAELTLNTNDPARVAITQLLSGQNESYKEINILSEGAEINYLFLNDENVVEVDVTSAFEENMAGSTGELFGIYTFVNTLSKYYGTQEVLLTVDGRPYNGSHITLEEGEVFTLNEEMVNEQ